MRLRALMGIGASEADSLPVVITEIPRENSHLMRAVWKLALTAMEARKPEVATVSRRR